MTDFLRNILVTAAANANAAAAHANNATNDVKVELSQPMHALIQIPAATTTATTTPSPMAVEKQRLIKVELTETPSTDAGKAQRAARRDVVNARRDKRKAMAHAATSPASPSMHTSGCSSSSDDDDDMDDYDDKSKKMKTGVSTSVAVAGGLGASDKASRPSFSSTMPPTPGLLFTPEIDAAGEERLRAMEAQLETLDPDSKEAKKKRRLIRNRMSAQLHRERKKAYVGQLEDQLMEKDRELKLLQEKLAQLMAEKETTAKSAAETTTPPAPAQPVVETPAPVAPVVAEEQEEPKATTPAPLVDEHKTVDDEIVIKEEPATWDSPWAMDSWALDGLEDAEMADSDLDLLRDFDDPFAGLGGAADYGVDMTKPHHEIHAAKKNLAMMAAVMFSVSFFGNTPSFYNVTPGSNFSSMFGAHTAKDLSQMSVASRIVACLEKTSWKEFRDVSTWLSAQTKEGTTATTEEEVAVASPSAASDVTDATTEAAGSPAHSVDEDVPMETDLIDEFEYPVDDAFASAHSADWFAADHDILAKEQPETTKVDTTTTVSSLSSRLYQKLTALWREKNQVLLTVRDDKQQVLQRSVADMSSIREGLQSGNLFAKVFGADVEAAQDQSVTFLYPMSAFSQESKPSLQPAEVEGVDPMFLEVSCQMNGGVATSMM